MSNESSSPGTAKLPSAVQTPPPIPPAPNTPITAKSFTITPPTTIVSTPPSIIIGKKKRLVTDLKCSEIRWFLKKDNDTKWSPLKGYDSMIVEVAWRNRNGIVVDEETQKLFNEMPKTDDVICLEGLYMLDTKSERLDSVYWKDESLPLRRGSWFQVDTMQPLSMDLADTIEKHHLTSFRNQSIPEGPVFSDTESSKRPVLTTISWNEHDEIRWNSVIDIVWYNNSKTNRLIRFVTRSKGTVLRRGYTEEANLDDGKPNFSDLILVVHGIGQKGYENLIAKNTGQMREVILHLMDKYYPNEKRRPMILPIEWRASLILDKGLTDVITLPRMPSMRHALNSIAMDIMYYQSPLYRSEIINGVIRSMNHTYQIFTRNNRNFSGKISLVAHSLGSVIAYDVLTNWSPLLLYDQFVTSAIKEHLKQSGIDEEERKILEDFHSSRVKLFEDEDKVNSILLKTDEKLEFQVENMFAIGSPLAVFLVMRGVDFKKVLPNNENVKHIYNIFHPYDPVAYRLEPLYDSHYKHIRPVKLFYYADDRAKQNYAKLPYELHKSYVRKLKKQQKKEKDKSKNGDKDDSKEEEDDDSDDDDNSDALSTGSSPRSESPVPSEEAGAGNNVPPELPAPGGSKSKGGWWKFGGGSAVVAPSTQTEEPIELAKEADSGGSAASSISPIPPAAHTANGPKPLTLIEALVDKIPPDRRLQANIHSEIQRLDFFLQPSLTEKSYWSLLKSHFAYWQSYDLIAFMLNVLYPQPSEQPVAAAAAAAAASASHHH
uniref:DDHD domain-containing protein n=1 Tax=Panagrolaimus sp. PS1159 TaxID=55785 RepID=A0AC35FS09_9BILA